MDLHYWEAKNVWQKSFCLSINDVLFAITEPRLSGVASEA